MVKPKIIKHMSVEELNDEIRELEKVSKVVNRLHLIRQVYRTNDIVKSCEILDIPVRTGNDWVKKWNEKGIDGLRHKQGAGRPSFLTEEQLLELDKWIEKEGFLVTNDVYFHIKDNFGVDYTLKQVRKIIRKLGYTWVKPYPIADKQPENAKDLLKEKIYSINPNNDIYGFIDEVAVQNTSNVRKIIKKKDHNLK